MGLVSAADRMKGVFSRLALVVGPGAVAALCWVLYRSRTALTTTTDTVTPTAAESIWPAGGRLFLASVMLALCAAFLALVCGFVVGIHLGKSSRTRLAALSLVPLFIPPHVSAYVWRFTLEDLARACAPHAALWRSPGASFIAAAWTLAAIYWPLIALPTALSLHLWGNRLVEELATITPPRAVFWRAIVPGLAPAMLMGTGLVFLLSLASYGVPLMWNIPSQAVAVFARLSAYYDAGSVVTLALPLLATALALSGAGILWLRRTPYAFDLTQSRPAATRGARFSPCAVETYLVLAATVGVPLASLVTCAPMLRNLGAALQAGIGPFASGMGIAAVGASGATALGAGLAVITRHRRRWISSTIEVVGLCALFMPAAVLCLGLAGLLSRPGVLGGVYESRAVFALAYGARYFYVPWKLARLFLSTESAGLCDTRRMLGLSVFTRAKLAVGGLLRPALCCGWLLVGAFIMGELELATFLAQPGRQPVSIFLANLMHYGRSAEVIQWSFLVVTAEIILAWLVLRIGLAPWRRLCVGS